jgi:drug/metabolite transporter (DMT)-like permease
LLNREHGSHRRLPFETSGPFTGRAAISAAHRRRRSRGLRVGLAFFVVWIVYGGNPLFIRITVRHHIPALLGTGTRYALAGLTLLTIMMLIGRPIRLERPAVGATALSGSLLLGCVGLFAIAVKSVDSGLASVVLAVQPLVVVVLMCTVGGERVSPVRLLGVGAGFAGVATLLLADGTAVSGEPAAIALLLVVAVATAGGVFLAPRLPLPDNAFVSAGWQMLWAGTILVAGAVIEGDLGRLDLGAITLGAGIAWVYLVVVGTMLTFSCVVWLLQRVPVSHVAASAYLNPVVAVILGLVFAGESMPMASLVGGLIVVMSVAVTVRGNVPAMPTASRTAVAKDPEAQAE